MSLRSAPVRALIVDDSAVIRQLLKLLLAEDPEIDVVGMAPDPFIAREMIKELNPDVVTLDIEMPRMDGLTFLEKIMTLRPMPVVMISTLTQSNAEATVRALEIGAVDFIAKPTVNVANAMQAVAGEICAKVKAAATLRSRLTLLRNRAPHAVQHRSSPSIAASDRIAFIGASTGGVEALKTLLTHMPGECPPILITQHMPERFTKSFAQRLDQLCELKVVEAEDAMPVSFGCVYIAPGSHHLEIARSSGKFICRLHDGPTVSGHRPSVDVLFRSAAGLLGRKAVGVILTGMGKDGAEGLLEMRAAGATTLGQDEASSLIYGMPQVAFERGAVMRQFPLDGMAAALTSALASEPALT